ncbi:hypothetical protein IC229_29860 [Spirosoma sp. BT702]|uniref:Uncharacterized protein n=1 Tax=Spirosoma profusum TaxID=2771354 RepID=A0A927GA79_9BACT|nr:hypothetical protein [Spirosoma profusum]MBD2704875.1 hypothetical protein [Spirosoma profusum]
MLGTLLGKTSGHVVPTGVDDQLVGRGSIGNYSRTVSPGNNPRAARYGERHRAGGGTGLAGRSGAETGRGGTDLSGTRGDFDVLRNITVQTIGHGFARRGGSPRRERVGNLLKAAVAGAIPNVDKPLASGCLDHIGFGKDQVVTTVLIGRCALFEEDGNGGGFAQGGAKLEPHGLALQRTGVGAGRRHPGERTGAHPLALDRQADQLLFFKQAPRRAVGGAAQEGKIGRGQGLGQFPPQGVGDARGALPA